MEEVIRWKFLTSLTGQNAFNDVIRELLALPVRLGSLGITNPSADTTAHHDASKKITLHSKLSSWNNPTSTPTP